jgi:hypothetical protein
VRVSFAQAEGKAGAFHLELQSVRAVTLGRSDGNSKDPQQQQHHQQQQQQLVGASAGSDWNNTCGARTQKNLRWNVSVAGSYIQASGGCVLLRVVLWAAL